MSETDLVRIAEREVIEAVRKWSQRVRKDQPTFRWMEEDDLFKAVALLESREQLAPQKYQGKGGDENAICPACGSEAWAHRCPDTEMTQMLKIARETAQHDPDHLNPDKGGNDVDYWRER